MNQANHKDENHSRIWFLLSQFSQSLLLLQVRYKTVKFDEKFKYNKFHRLLERIITIVMLDDFCTILERILFYFKEY